MPPQKQITKKEQHLKNLRHATHVVRNSLFLIVILAVVKGLGGYLTNIVSLSGDAVGSISDIVANLAIYIGLRLSLHRANGKFKYGFHRVETLISLCLALLILYLGYHIGTESIDRLRHPAVTTLHSFGIAAACVSIVGSLFAFVYQKSMGEKINSRALVASAYDKRNDVMVSFSVLLSVIADKLQVPYVEGIVGLLIAGLILFSGLQHGKEALLYLLDYWDSPEVTKQIKTILLQSKIVTAIKKIRLRHAGTYIFGEAFIQVNPFTESKDLRDEIHRLDHLIETNVEHLGDLVLYIDPPKPANIRVAIPIVEEKGLQSIIAENSMQRFRFFFVEIRGGGIHSFYSRPEEFSTDEVSNIAASLKKEKVNILISSLIRPLLYYNLRLNNIKVYPHFLDVKDVENTVKLLLLDI